MSIQHSASNGGQSLSIWEYRHLLIYQVNKCFINQFEKVHHFDVTIFDLSVVVVSMVLHKVRFFRYLKQVVCTICVSFLSR